MIRCLILVLCIGLTGCATGDNPQAQCQRQADNDPKVREIYTRTNGDYTFDGYQAHYDLIAAKQQAELRCMRALGLAPPGGVEPIKPHLQCATC